MNPHARVRLTSLTCLAAVLSATATSAFGQLPAPLLYFTFDEASGAPIATDSSGNNYNGTVVNSVTFGEVGAPGGATPSGAARFTNGILNVTSFDVPTLLGNRDNAALANKSYTMSAWVKPDAVSLSGDRFFIGQWTQGIHNGLRNNGRLHQAHWSNDHYANTLLNATDWVHATFVYDGVADLGTIYLNGAADSAPTAKPSPNGSGNLIIGGRQGNANGGTGQLWFNGLLDDLAIWDSVLTPAQIALLAAGTSPIEVEDSDNDNLPDGYERFITGGNDLTVLNGDGVADADLDGLSDFREFDETKTNPLLADTDGDGLEDGDEVAGNNASGSPTGFGPTKALDADSDDDGLADGAELSLANGFVTNPNNVDTDGDFSLDKYEIDNLFDPTDPGSKPDILVIQPSFDPIHSLGMNVEYAPGLGTGWDVEQNFYPASGVSQTNALANYTLHTSGAPAPTSSETSVQPYLDFGPGGTLPRNLPFPSGGGDDFTVRANAYVLFERGGLYMLHHGADDTTYTAIDTGTGSPMIAQNSCCGSSTAPFTIGAPGYYPFDFVFGERGGGEWLDLGISGPGIPGTVALGDSAAGSPLVFLISVPFDDTDGDGIPDAYEELYFPGDLTKLGLGDFDMDGVSDPDEYNNRTNPTLKDTDMDGLDDGDEVIAMTDPLNPDTDGDTILDGEEVVSGADGYITNPLLADTDMDGWDDPIEILAGSDPADGGSVPPASKLPINDDFDDGLLNVVDWKTNLTIPQGGASVVEAGGNLTMTGRGYLITVGEFDPEVVGGLRIAGQWTFGTADDFMQVVLRSDGLPAGDYGETANGIEFNVALTDAVKDLQILTRDATTITVTQGVAGVLANAAAGMTFDFEIIDDGLGMLSFTMTEAGNPANTATTTATVDSDTFAQNFIAFHNRENARVSSLDNLSITSLVDSSTFRITDILYDGGTERFTLSWQANESATYALFWTQNPSVGGWGADINDSISATGGDPLVNFTDGILTYGPFDNPVPGAPLVLFRVERN